MSVFAAVLPDVRVRSFHLEVLRADAGAAVVGMPELDADDVAVLLAEPWAALALAGLFYLGMVPFSVQSYLRLKREAESLLEHVVVGGTDNG